MGFIRNYVQVKILSKHLLNMILEIIICIIINKLFKIKKDNFYFLNK